ncbi:vascular endothelial growth factor receptor 1-like isoform X2 [Amphibalanus amphitrite]|nr:vascular endothelial growth factor receptor 1-like isoform X2 [Amphibalanus amphitrite]
MRPPRKTTTTGFTSELAVTDARPEDTGGYTCRVEDHNGHTNNRSVRVTVHSPNVSSVNLQTDVQAFSLRLGDSVKIVVNVEARPAPVITWFDPDDAVIITDPQKYEVSHTTEQTILKILDLRLEDMGQYRVEAMASSNTSSDFDELIFNVTVNAEAEVRLDASEGYYLAGERYQLRCTATGYPTPSLEWRFEACNSSLSCPPDFPLPAVTLANDEQETQLESKPFLVQSDLTLTANLSGVYWCYANNSESDVPAVAEHRFFVSDIPRGFGILRSNSTIIEGDNVTLSCGGSTLDFPSPSSFEWQWSRSETARPVPVTDLPGVRVVDRSTGYSHRRVLLLEPVQMAHAGLFMCSGTDVLGVQQRSNTMLGVTASQKPVFTSEANMDKSASLELEEGDRAVFNCTVSGRPTPTITWTKDGAPLQLEDNTRRIRLLSGGQRLVIGTVLSSDAGNYECRAANRQGTVWGSAELLVPDEDTVTRVVVPVVVLLSLMLVALIACLAWKCRQQQGLQKRLTRLELEAFHKGRPEQINPDLPIDEQAELLPYEEDEWEFPKDRLILGRQIGSGAFGRVVKADAIGLTADQQRTTVAVKMPKSGSDPDQIRSLMSELKIMIQLGKHLNVVNLLGAVTKHAAQGEFMVMVEYCRHGNLHQYLHRHKNSFINQVHPITGEFDATLGEEEYAAAMRRDSTSESTPLQYASLAHSSDGQVTITPGRSLYRPPRRGSTSSSVHSAAWDSTDPTGAGAEDSVCQSPSALDDEPRFATLSGGGRRPRRTPLTTRDLLQWSYQVARGMEYLASRKLLHGDLAARNILLAESRIVKISDFGLSRDIYKTKDYRKKGKGLLPVKWMAIESIQESLFSTQSDVWSFGVVMWEFFSLGATPYPGMEYDVNFVRRLRDGYRMEAPKFSPSSTYQLMLDCWKETPGTRPSFTEISERLGHYLEEQVKKDYIQLNEPYQVMNSEYFNRRVDYVNTLISPDYQNVTPRGEPLGAASERGSVGSQGSQEGVTVWPDTGVAGYIALSKGGAPAPLVDDDSYLLMSPGPDSSPDGGVFSPRPRGGAGHFEFPPPPQLARESPPNGFYNPSYHEAGKGRVPSTPKMGTKVSRPARPAVAEASEEHRDQREDTPVASSPAPDEDDTSRLPSGVEADTHYRVPVPVGCEQLV